MTRNVGENLYNKIDTFVFFDLETTDFIRGTTMPKITELSMVAASRNSLTSDRRNKLAVPRVLHKLTIPICPTKPINPQASFVSSKSFFKLFAFIHFKCKTTINFIFRFME